MGRAATPTLFGFDFQANAAIVIMLKNIKTMKSIRLEGAEDIDLILSDGSRILAQAKAVQRPNEDFNNVTTNLKNALESLADSNRRHSNINQLIYITNTPRPFGLREQSGIYYGAPTYRYFDDLTSELKSQITTYLTDLNLTLDTSKLFIQTVPFDSMIEEERYKEVIDHIKSFLYGIPGLTVRPQDLHKIWKDDLFHSGTIREHDVYLSKNDIIWPIIVLATKYDNYDDYDLDEAQCQEVSRLYADIINTCSEKYEFVTKVLSAYNQFNTTVPGREKIREFARQKVADFYEIFDGQDVHQDLRDVLLQIIIRNILNKRYLINEIGKAAEL